MSVSNRVALAPIKDSCLNTSSSRSKPGSRDSTPLRKRRSAKLAESGPVSSSSATSMASTPATLTPQKRPVSLVLIPTGSAQSTPTGASMPSGPIAAFRRFSPVKSRSFSDYRSTSSTSSSPHASRTSKTDTAGLAATKLKLKLQLALYKLQQSQKSRKNPVDSGISASPSIALDSKTAANQSTAASAAALSSSSLTVSRPPFSALKSMPNSIKRPYLSSVNINLKTKARLLTHKRTFPSLSNIACHDHAAAKKVQKLRLFKIKKNSIFYSGNPNRQLPLSVNNVRLPKPVLTSLANSVTSQNAEEALRLPSASHMPHNSFLLPHVQQASAPKSTHLPSINKILKTPIKNAGSSRFNTITNSANTHSVDDTIDEDNDLTIINTTAVNKSSDEVVEDLKPKPEPTPKLNRKRSTSNILTSSPIANFGTPNSFSVAKSLLQLGGYSM